MIGRWLKRGIVRIFSRAIMTSAEEKPDKIITEGKAKIFSPGNVFYNPVQEFNRDLSIAVTSQVIESILSNPKKQKSILEATVENKIEATFEKSKKIRILEALAATGLRSVRFALEIPNVSEVIANDFDKTAVQYIEKNAEANGVSSIVKPSYADASMKMYESRNFVDRFHVVDLDPYGSPTLFLDAAVQCVADGGLLSVTCTDMAVLCGNSPETCHSKYGSVSLKSRFCHEMALRILLRSIESHANRYSRYIVPMLSISVDFYCRVFVRVFTSPQMVKHSASKLSYVYQCTGCGSFHLQKLCENVKTTAKLSEFKFVPSNNIPINGQCKNCSGRHAIGGPIWTNAIHDQEFVRKLLENVEKRKGDFKTSDRMLGMLTVIEEELADQPLYYDTDKICSTLHCNSLGFLPMRSALLNGGYKVSLSHASKNSIKTNAPMEIMWDIMRCWVKKNPISEHRSKEDSVAARILSQSISFEADFTPHPNANPPSRKKGLLRWQMNPEKEWGPKPKAGRDEKVIQKKRKAEENQKEIKRARILKETQKHPCKRFRSGNCEYGDECVYSHVEEQTDQNNEGNESK